MRPVLPHERVRDAIEEKARAIFGANLSLRQGRDAAALLPSISRLPDTATFSISHASIPLKREERSREICRTKTAPIHSNSGDGALHRVQVDSMATSPPIDGPERPTKDSRHPASAPIGCSCLLNWSLT